MHNSGNRKLIKMTTYDKNELWNEVYGRNTNVAYPPEAVIRILLGDFPELSFFNREFDGKKILDIGYGDGRNFPLFARVGLNISGVEITNEIVTNSLSQSTFDGLDLDLKVGECSQLPYKDSTFDYAISWNSSYYLDSNNANYKEHADEMLRVIKPGGFLILSVPKKNAFIFKNCHDLGNGNVVIKDDYFDGGRVGQVFRRFLSGDELEKYFIENSQNIATAEIDMKWFGLEYNWFVTVLQKNN